MTITSTAGNVREPNEVTSSVEREERILRWAAIFFALAVLIHNSDHVRRGAGALNLDVFWAGTLALTLEVGVVILVFLRHRLAPLAAIAVGFPLAIGYVIVHFTPDHGLLSDSLLSSGKAVSIVAAADTREAAAEAMAGLPPLVSAPAERRPRRGRGHGEAEKPQPDWQPTSERFRDPRTRAVLRVWVDPGGARHYVAE